MRKHLMTAPKCSTIGASALNSTSSTERVFLPENDFPYL